MPMDYRTVASQRGNSPAEHFAQVPLNEVPRSVFDRSHGHKTTFSHGDLIPILVDEALPGDTFTCRMAAMIRMATPFFPVMDNIFADFFFFAVPYRLLWSNFGKFMGAQTNPGDSTAFQLPQMTAHAVVVNTLADYMGIPSNPGAPFNIGYCSLPMRAYNLIWNEWFRDENLQNSITVDLGDGPDSSANYVLRKRGKRHDYFTSCLPFVQKGTAPTMALAVSGIGAPSFSTDAGVTPKTLTGVGGGTTFVINAGTWPGAGPNPATWVDPKLSIGGFTINAFREVFAFQQMFERDARGGTRLQEVILSHFGVRGEDFRLQRPEFLGGGTTRINVHPVARTSFTGGASAAQLSAFATGQVDGIGFMKSFVEHSWVIGLVNIRADMTYQEGLERQWSRLNRFDLYWPGLAHLGEQAVLNKEIFARGTGNDALTFGYQERWAEYRYKPSRTSGKFRSTDGTPLDAWHLGQEFGSLPLLNSTFIEDQYPFFRVMAITTEPEFIADFWFDYRCARPMPTYSIPGLMGRF